jgi:hypothetical protein
VKLYRGQIGSVTDEKLYASALRELAKLPTFCAPTFAKKGPTEDRVQQAIAKLSDKKLVTYVQIAGQLSGADSAFAEEWLLRQLGFNVNS